MMQAGQGGEDPPKRRCITCNTLDERCNFKQAFDETPLDVCETFVSIQGEGRDSGAHAQFIRLAGCNLRCPWCDTKHSWTAGRPLSQVDTIAMLARYRKHYGSNYVVWTGGEPLLQELRIYSVIEKTRPFYHLLETNGTIIPEKPHLFNAIAVSPKDGAPTGAPFDGARWRNIRNAYVKLVVSCIEEAVAFQNVWHFDPQWFFVMARSELPMTPEKQILAERKIAQGCIEHGFNFSPRLQVYFKVK